MRCFSRGLPCARCAQRTRPARYGSSSSARCCPVDRVEKPHRAMQDIGMSDPRRPATDRPARRLRAGMVGGGQGAFIGSVHRTAVELDGQAQLVAGALSSRPDIARESAAAWFLERAYSSYSEMAAAEAAARDGIDFVIIATPNDLHLPIAQTFLTAGIHVVCDKPLALSVDEGRQLVKLVE